MLIHIVYACFLNFTLYCKHSPLSSPLTDWCASLGVSGHLFTSLHILTFTAAVAQPLPAVPQVTLPFLKFGDYLLTFFLSVFRIVSITEKYLIFLPKILAPFQFVQVIVTFFLHSEHHIHPWLIYMYRYRYTFVYKVGMSKNFICLVCTENKLLIFMVSKYLCHLREVQISYLYFVLKLKIATFNWLNKCLLILLR